MVFVYEICFQARASPTIAVIYEEWSIPTVAMFVLLMNLFAIRYFWRNVPQSYAYFTIVRINSPSYKH